MSNNPRSFKSSASRNATQDLVRVPWYPFSVLSPYLTTCLPGEGHGDPTTLNDFTSRQNGPCYDSRYITTPSLHSLPDEMPTLIRKELQIIFFELTALCLRHEDSYTIRWRRHGSMTSINTKRRLLDRRIATGDITQFLNKEIIVYFESESVDDFYSGKIARYIYSEWLHLHDGRPPFQRHSFFAKAMQIDENGPRNLEQLSVFHRGIYKQLSSQLDNTVNFYPVSRLTSRKTSRKIPLFEPIPSSKIQSWRDSGYILRHLFRALYMVVDSQALAEVLQAGPVRQEREHDGADGHLGGSLSRKLSRCTVLLVKTGDEAHLHSPISFLPLFDAGLAMDVNREDYHGGDTEETAVRVRLDVGMRFIYELLCREEEDVDEVRQVAQGLRQEQEAFCNAWVERVMAHSHEVGTDNNGYTWLAIRRALARMNGEAFEREQVYPLWEGVNF